MIEPTVHLEWMDRSACLDSDPELFFPEGRYQEAWIKEAKAVCRSCPVRELCLERALDNKEEFGVFGGTTLADRRRMVRNNARKSRAKELTA